MFRPPMISVFQDTRGTRDESTQGWEEHHGLEKTVLEQLNHKIHQLQVVLEIIDAKEQMLALLDKLKVIHDQLQELLHRLEQS